MRRGRDGEREWWEWGQVERGNGGRREIGKGKGSEIKIKKWMGKS